MSKDGEYWRKRFKQMEEAQNERSVKKIMQIQEQFDRSLSEIDKKISVWYQRLADNNGVTMTEAKKMLTDKERKEFRWTVEEYIKYGRDNDKTQRWVKELENASARVHIERLEALKYEIHAEAGKLYESYHDLVGEHIKDAYKNNYYHTAYELHRGFGTGSDIQGLNQKVVEKIVTKPWAVDEKNFSERIWTDKAKLINTAHQSLSKMCITGSSPEVAVQEIAKAMNVSKSQARNLVMTESAAFSNKANQEAMTELGVEEFEVIETLDRKTCSLCGDMDAKHYPMADFVIGVTAPPFHPHCRGFTCPYFNDEFTVGEERIARGEDGKTYYVPADMSYKDWKKSFVDGDKSGLIEVGLEKVLNFDIIKSELVNTKEVSDVEITNLGKINKTLMEKEFGELQTDDIIITNERIKHIQQHHPEDYEFFKKFGVDSVTDPDLIIKDLSNKGTVFMVKKLPDTNLNVIVRLALGTDKPGLKNSIMTFYRIRERNLKKMIEKNSLLYKKE